MMRTKTTATIVAAVGASFHQAGIHHAEVYRAARLTEGNENGVSMAMTARRRVRAPAVSADRP